VLNYTYHEKAFCNVADGAMRFTHGRVAAIHLLIQSSDLTKFDSKCNSGLTRLDGKVQFIIYCVNHPVIIVIHRILTEWRYGRLLPETVY